LFAWLTNLAGLKRLQRPTTATAIVDTMPTPAITLEALPAGYGDCLLISCPLGRRTWRMLIDTGPDETYPALKARLAKLSPNQHGKRHIDLFIVSHIDHDHIGGAALLLNDQSLGLTFGDIWFNAPPQPAVRGVAEGESLAKILGADDTPLPWNMAFGGKNVVVGGDGEFVELADARGTPRITLLSPTRSRLKSLYRVWDKEMARLRNKERDVPGPVEPVPRDMSSLDIKALAAKITATDSSTANGSSIAMLLEHRGASVLLSADAFPTVLVPALQALARQRKQPGGMALDAIKLSHHGSRANVTNELLKTVRADHYIVSTNGAIFSHPDDEAVARVLVHGGRQPTLWFNYATERNRRWAEPALRSKYGHQVQYPASGRTGLVIGLAGRAV
jgi:beta-lactamase superfamily II metal-dependent hydrolase